MPALQKVRESNIEKKVCEYAKSKGWLNYKWVSPNNRGVPDRLFFKAGKMVIVEFKAANKKATKLQQYHINLLQQHSFSVHVIDNIEAGKELIDVSEKQLTQLPKTSG